MVSALAGWARGTGGDHRHHGWKWSPSSVRSFWLCFWWVNLIVTIFTNSSCAPREHLPSWYLSWEQMRRCQSSWSPMGLVFILPENRPHSHPYTLIPMPETVPRTADSATSHHTVASHMNILPMLAQNTEGYFTHFCLALWFRVISRSSGWKFELPEGSFLKKVVATPAFAANKLKLINIHTDQSWLPEMNFWNLPGPKRGRALPPEHSLKWLFLWHKSSRKSSTHHLLGLCSKRGPIVTGFLSYPSAPGI